MADRDWAQSGNGASIQATPYGGNPPTYQNVGNVGDGDDASYCNITGNGYLSGLRIDITFAEIVNYVSEIKFREWAASVHAQFDIAVVWMNDTYTQIGSENGDSVINWHSYATGWQQVKGVRLWIIGTQYTNDDSKIYTIAALGETQYGQVKYKTDAVTITLVSLEPTAISAHSFRYYDGSKILTIPLVATDSPAASPLRVYHGAAVKALMKRTFL